MALRPGARQRSLIQKNKNKFIKDESVINGWLLQISCSSFLLTYNCIYLIFPASIDCV